jgi:predicted DCC family thiol-disulfide oxidoreductase YuxK
METFEIEVFYDGDCPLCMREIRTLRRLDRAARIRFTDIASPYFDAATLGLDHAAMMRKIYGRLPSGELISGVEVFRRLYSAVGFGPLVTLTRTPGVKQLLDLGYELFAKNRLKLTGRCENGVCELPARRAA